MAVSHFSVGKEVKGECIFTLLQLCRSLQARGDGDHFRMDLMCDADCFDLMLSNEIQTRARAPSSAPLARTTLARSIAERKRRRCSNGEHPVGVGRVRAVVQFHFRASLQRASCKILRIQRKGNRGCRRSWLNLAEFWSCGPKEIMRPAAGAAWRQGYTAARTFGATANQVRPKRGARRASRCIGPGRATLERRACPHRAQLMSRTAPRRWSPTRTRSAVLWWRP